MSIQEEKSTEMHCFECNSSTLITDMIRGETTCHSCGLVLDTMIFDTGKEWRAYNATEEKYRARSGDPVNLLVADSLSTSFLDQSQYDAKGKKLSPQQRWIFKRLGNLDQRRKGTIRNLRMALRELHRLTSQLSVGETVARTASVIYRNALKENLIRGRSIDGMIAASLYLACRKEGIPLTIKELLSYTDKPQKELSRYIRILIDYFKLRSTVIKPEVYVLRLSNLLGMSMPTTQLGITYIQQASKAGILIGKHPMSVAAAALYLAGIQSGERLTQEQLAIPSRTTPVTIRNRSKELIEVLQLQVEVKRGPIPLNYTDDPFMISQEI